MSPKHGARTKGTEALSQAEMVLLAIYHASKRTAGRVPFEEIVIRAWKDFPGQFSLNNHPEYPDSYPVSKRLSSDLITGRLVVSLRKEIYRLTYRGLDLAKELEMSISHPKLAQPKPLNVPNRDEEEFLKHAVRSRAFVTWTQGKKQSLIDFDARTFFQFSTGTPVRERKRKAENARDAIDKAVALGTNEAKDLKDLFLFLVENFPNLFEEG